MTQLIGIPKSVIPACDVDSLEKLELLVAATCEIPGIGAYKVGLELALPFSIPKVVQLIRCYTKKPIIYDHQKAGNDIPDVGIKFAKAVKGADAVILFPFAGGETQPAWIKACQDSGLIVLVGGHMTHPKFLKSQGGYIDDDAPRRIYTMAAEMGVDHFIVPGNQPDYVVLYRRLLESLLGINEFRLSAPGFITQLGDISETGKAAGNFWDAIVGTALYKHNTFDLIESAARNLVAQILAV